MNPTRPVQPLRGKRILLGITGSIAAYKSALIARALVREGAQVKVVMTAGATEFITPLTLATLTGFAVHSDFTEDRQAGTWTNHVELGLWGDLILVAPATAHTISAMVSGHCDNLLQAVMLSARCPIAVAPAMDLDMYAHPSTQANLDVLRERGVNTIEPGTGWLASGLEGKGRMEEPEAIVDWVQDYFASKAPWSGIPVLITAGPTYEPIDAVRFIGNYSTGKMGYALAKTLVAAGAEVHLVSGPSALVVPEGLASFTAVQTAAEMHAAVLSRWSECRVGIACAAVADVRPAVTHSAKWHRNELPSALPLEPTPDILADMGRSKTTEQYLMGFALESDEGMTSAQSKLSRKNCDSIVLNSLLTDGAGFGTDTNEVVVLTRGGDSHKFELKQKDEIAREIVAFLSNTLQIPKP
jgi:phosphopantothenoylcysteine decarboxylase/phosphopantothenate--cysteine ligase